MNKSGSNGRLVEFMICLAIGSVITVLLFKLCFAAIKPLTDKLNEIKTNNTEYSLILEEIEEE